MNKGNSQNKTSGKKNIEQLQQLPGRLTRQIRWLATHPKVCLALVVVPFSLYLCLISAAQWMNRAEIHAIATAQATVAGPLLPTLTPSLQPPGSTSP